MLANLDTVGPSVSPVQVPGHPVHGDAVWVFELRCDQHCRSVSVNVGPADGLDLIVRPINVTLHWVVIYGDGVANIINLREQCSSWTISQIPLPDDVQTVFVYVCLCVPVCVYLQHDITEIRQVK